MKTYLSMIALLCAMITASTAAADGGWKTYPSSTTALAYDGEYFWLGQEYKVLKWHKEKGIVAEYDKKDGLSGVRIYKIYISPDKKTVWAASDSGIARFDGDTWRNFTVHDGLADNKTGYCAFAGNDTLWVGSGKGVSRFDGKKWTTFTTKDGLANNNVHTIAVDKDHILWCTTDDGVSAYDGKNWKVYTTEDGLVENGVYHIVVDKNNVKWFGATGGNIGGISRYDGSTWTSYTMANGKVSAKGVQEMALSPDNTLWVSMGDVRHYTPPSGGNGIDLYYAYLYKYDNQKFVLDRSYSSEGYESLAFYTGLVFDNNGKLYILSWLNKKSLYLTRKDAICDNTNTIWFLEGKEWTNFLWLAYLSRDETLHPVGFGPPPGNICALTVGLENEIWCGESGNSLAEFKNNTWKLQPYEYSPLRGIECLTTNESETVWVGGGDTKLIKFQWDIYTKYYEYLGDFWTSDTIHSLSFDKNNILWMGFGPDSKGVIKYDGATWITYTTVDGLVDDRVHAIAVDAANTKWFGTSAGLSRYDGISWTSFPTAENGNPVGGVNTLACDGALLWSGTNSGLLRYDGSSWARFTPKDGLADTSVISLAIGQKGVVWAGTPSGLSRFDGKSWRTFKTADGLPSDRVQALAVDHDNVVWIGTDKGLVSYQEDTGTFVQENNALPATFPAITSYPNPFNPSTTIEFTIPFARDTELSVYSITGQKVRSLVAGTLTPGKHTARWDGRDAAGKNVSSGIYIARLVTGGKVTVKKMVMVK